MQEQEHGTPSPAGRLALAFLYALLAACGGATAPGPEAQINAMVRSEWDAYKAANGVSAGGLAVHLVTPRGTYSGAADLGPVDVPNVHFRAASNTKTFTSAAIMLLYQQGMLNIDDTITSVIPRKAIPYVPDTPQYAIPHKSSITIRQLLTHTAGVFDNTNNAVPATCPAPYANQSYLDYVMDVLGQKDHTFTFDEMVGVNATCNVEKAAPGTEYSYSNIGYDLLGKIIERVSGLSYADYVAQKLLAPNQLTQTTMPYLGTDQLVPAPNLVGYDMGDGVTRSFTQDNMSGNVAEGNVISTPAELARWVRLLISGNAGIGPTYVSMMKVCGFPASASCYGMGIFNAPGLGWGHNGAHRGYISLMLYNPDDDVAVVVFSTMLDEDHISSDLGMLQRVASKARQLAGYGGSPGM